MSTEAREIAYSRDGYEPSVGVCPMCGVETTCGLACDTCFRAHRNDASKPPYGDVPSVEDRIAATTKRDAYCAGKRGIDALRGEVEWAERKTDEEIETVRRRWRALRHRAIEGNEAVWPVLKEEEASW